MIACTNKLPRVAEKLIDTFKSNPGQVNNEGNTALLIAASNRLDYICAKLIDTRKSKPWQVNNDGNTALIYACLNGINNISLKLIGTGQSNPGQVNRKGNTALIIACYKTMTHVALKLIETGQSKPEQVNNDGNTALIFACSNKIDIVALKLIETGQSKPEQVSNEGNTALLFACYKNMDAVALKLIETGQSKPEQVNNEGNTALLFACLYKMENIAIKLIETGQSKPEVINVNGDTSLMLACSNKMDAVALKLIETGQSNPGQINNNMYTALFLACHNKMENVALKLIETGQSKPGQVVTNNSITALIVTCFRKLENVAIKLIETGQSNPEHIDNFGKDALYYAESNNLTNVVDLLKKETIHTYNLLKRGYDMINGEDIIIQDFLKKSEKNLCFIIDKKAFLTDKGSIKKIINDDVNIKYGCKRAGNTSEFILDENVNYNMEYLNMSMLIPMQIFVKLDEINSIIYNKLSNRIFELKNTGLKLPAIISKAFLNGSGGVGADHCQPGKETEVYTFTNVLPVCEREETNESTEQTETNINVEPIINVMYKGVTYKINVNETMNIGDLKQSLITKLLSENVINSNNQNVRFVYLGKVYTDNSMVLSQLPNFSYGITLQAMMNQIGGKKRKTKKYKRCKGKQCHRYTRRN